MLHYTRVENEKIRLLQVELAEDVQYQLLNNVSPVPGGQSYTALSYTWGSSRHQQAILIDGCEIHVSQNLFKALCDITHYYRRLGHDRVFLWIDQICIDQENVAEKNKQVAYMSHIYQNAETVLVWLSVPKGSLHHRHSSVGDRTDSWLSWANTAICDGSHGLDLGLNNLSSAFGEWKLAWTGVLAIVRNPWWERAWVYQEFMLSREAFFLVDGHTLPWRPLHALLDSCLTRLRMYEAEENYYKSTNEWIVPRYRWPKSHYFRCPRCEQIKGGQWLKAFLTNPANWAFLAICYILIRMLPQEMAGHAGYASFFQRTLARTDQTKLWTPVSSCDCNVNDHRDTHLLRFPPLKAWKQSEYGKRWVLSVCKDRNFWTEAVWNTMFFTLLLVLRAYVWERVPVASSKINPHWIFLNTLLHEMLMKLPVSDFNDEVQDGSFEREPKFASWGGIYHETSHYWDLALSILQQRKDGIENLVMTTVIERARGTRSSDPRDKVYAYLGVLGLAGSDCNITIDYDSSNKVSAVLIQASEQIIIKGGRFDQLVLAIEDKASSLDSIHLPSWVPNWSRPRMLRSDYRSSREKAMKNEYRHIWRASKDERAIVSFYTNRKGHRILRAQAIYIETLGPRQSWIKPNGYKGRDSGVDILTLATLDNPPRTGDEIWLLIGADTPFVLRNNALENAFGSLFGSILGNLMPNRYGIALGKHFCKITTYKVMCEAVVWDRNMSINKGGLIDSLEAGALGTTAIDIC